MSLCVFLSITVYVFVKIMLHVHRESKQKEASVQEAKPHGAQATGPLQTCHLFYQQ